MTIVTYTTGDGFVELDPPNHPVLIREVTASQDGIGDINVTITYEAGPPA